MFSKIAQIFKVADIRNKVLIIVGLLVVSRILATIPIPGIDVARLKDFFASNQLFGFLDLFSGGGLSSLSISMLGVGPYITAIIIMQLLTLIFPYLKKLYYEEGTMGRAKFNRVSRYITVPLAVLQAYGFLNLLSAQGIISSLSLFEIIRNVIIITTGTMILVWLGELISEQKIGNGISIIIFAGIVSQLPGTIQKAILTYDPNVLISYVAFAILALVVIAAIVFVNEAERRVPISYARQVRGNKMFGGASSYLPLKVNQAGVIPIIFAISVLLFPQFLAQISAIISPEFSVKATELVTRFFNNQFLYAGSYFLLVFLFTYFYTSVIFDPSEVSKNLQRAGGFIPGIRPGESTKQFFQKITGQITLFGATFLGVVAILPNITQLLTGIKMFALGGTSLLIVVAVVLDIVRQIDSQLTVREYEKI